MNCLCGSKMSRIEYSYTGDTRAMGDWDEILWACNSQDCNKICFEDIDYCDWYDRISLVDKK